mmetsp:Transcript_13448/g.29153  ORF Transcript_13448/g.29153 Transcript_13448/m.29153 type:complete len:208 (-) Transcript_13448:930-1553(-)
MPPLLPRVAFSTTVSGSSTQLTSAHCTQIYWELDHSVPAALTAFKLSRSASAVTLRRKARSEQRVINRRRYTDSLLEGRRSRHAHLDHHLDLQPVDLRVQGVSKRYALNREQALGRRESSTCTKTRPSSTSGGSASREPAHPHLPTRTPRPVPPRTPPTLPEPAHSHSTCTSSCAPPARVRCRDTNRVHGQLPRKTQEKSPFHLDDP